VSSELADVRGGGGEELEKEPNHTTARKPGPLLYVKYVLLSAGYSSWTSERRNVKHIILLECRFFLKFTPIYFFVSKTLCSDKNSLIPSLQHW
jgi:hypothetical protein